MGGCGRESLSPLPASGSPLPESIGAGSATGEDTWRGLFVVALGLPIQGEVVGVGVRLRLSRRSSRWRKTKSGSRIRAVRANIGGA